MVESRESPVQTTMNLGKRVNQINYQLFSNTNYVVALNEAKCKLLIMRYRLCSAVSLLITAIKSSAREHYFPSVTMAISVECKINSFPRMNHNIRNLTSVRSDWNARKILVLRETEKIKRLKFIVHFQISKYFFIRLHSKLFLETGTAECDLVIMNTKKKNHSIVNSHYWSVLRRKLNYFLLRFFLAIYNLRYYTDTQVVISKLDYICIV